MIWASCQASSLTAFFSSSSAIVRVRVGRFGLPAQGIPHTNPSRPEAILGAALPCLIDWRRGRRGLDRGSHPLPWSLSASSSNAGIQAHHIHTHHDAPPKLTYHHHPYYTRPHRGQRSHLRGKARQRRPGRQSSQRRLSPGLTVGVSGRLPYIDTASAAGPFIHQPCRASSA